MEKRSDYEDYSDEELKDRAEYDYDAREELKLRDMMRRNMNINIILPKN